MVLPHIRASLKACKVDKKLAIKGRLGRGLPKVVLELRDRALGEEPSMEGEIECSEVRASLRILGLKRLMCLDGGKQGEDM